MTSPLMPTYARADLAFERGEGAWLIATGGERYLDFAAGIAVTALGHAHPHLVRVLSEQAAKLWHTSNMYRIPGQERLAQRLVEASFADRVFFANSGAEAVECAIKTARRHFFVAGAPERNRLITFEGAFHGRTLATISAANNPAHVEGFAPLVPGFDQVPAGDIDKARAAIGPETAGILLEPIQGEGGVKPLSTSFLRQLRELCDEHRLLLIFDEVQTGVGRTGKLFAYEWSGVAPDIMAIAKGLGGGFPIGACLATNAAADGMVAGVHGSTFGGNPLAMAVGNGVLDIVLEPGFLDRVQESGSHLLQGLAMLADKYPRVVGGARGLGLMIGVHCRVPNTDLLKALVEQRLLAAKAGDNTVRLVPPLIVGKPEIHEALGRLERACARLDAEI